MGKERKFTLLFVPQDGGTSRSISLSTKWIRLSVICAIVIVSAAVALFLFLIDSHIRYGAPAKEFASSSQDYATVRGQIAECKSQIDILKTGPLPENYGKDALPKLSGVRELPLDVDAVKSAEIPGGLIQVKFRLTNADKKSSFSGYMVLLRVTGIGVVSFPAALNPRHPYLVDYRQGEHFYLQYFREVVGELPKLDDRADMYVLVFSEVGQLVMAKQIKDEL